MTTYSIVQGGDSIPHTGLAKMYTKSLVIDFAAVNRTADDILESLSIKAKTLVVGVQLEILTAEGGTLTLDVGDGDDDNGYMDGVEGNSLGSFYSGAGSLTLVEAQPNTILGYTNGKYYSAADTIDVIPKNTVDAAKVKITAVCIDLSGS